MRLKGVHTVVFDFDGVFTNNKVYVSESGQELVRCDRGDGLAISHLNHYINTNALCIDVFILSTEKNPVVARRAEKMKIKCYQGCDDKYLWLSHYLSKKGHYANKNFKGAVYLGNDINDLASMVACEYSFSPIDGHSKVQKVATKVCTSKGGEGFVREFIDHFLLPSLEIEMDKTNKMETVI